MKKVLSVILVLSMLIVPLKTMFGFADETKEASSQGFADVNSEVDYQQAIENLKQENIEKIELIITADKDTSSVKGILYGADGQRIRVREITEDELKSIKFDKLIESLQAVLKKFRYCKVEFIYEDLVKKEETPLTMNIYNRKGVLIESFRYKRLDDLSNPEAEVEIKSKVERRKILEKAKEKSQVSIVKTSMLSQTVIESSKFWGTLAYAVYLRTIFDTTSFGQEHPILATGISLLGAAVLEVMTYFFCTAVNYTITYELPMESLNSAYEWYE